MLATASGLVLFAIAGASRAVCRVLAGQVSSIRISYLPGGERDREPRGVDVTWDQLCTALGAGGVQPSPCTLETCGKGENLYSWTDKNGKLREGGCRHKYGGAWSPAVYPPGATRSKKNVGVVSLMVLDLDHVTDDEVAAVAARLAPYRYIAHSSHSDRKVVVRHLETGEPYEVEERALRVVVELSEPVLGTDWPRFWATAYEMLSGGEADPSVCDASRLYFLPTRRSDCEFTYTTNAGAPLDVRAVLAMAPPAEVLPELAGASDFPPASPALIERARDRLRRVGPAVEGEGGDRHTYSACCALLHDFALSDAEAWPLLVEWNTTCRPPWAEGDLRVKMENAKSYAEGPRGAGRLEFEGAEALREIFGEVDSSYQPPAELAAQVSVDVPPEGDVLAILGAISREHPALAEPKGEPGTWGFELARARRDVARALAAGVGDEVDAGEQQLFQAATRLLGEPPKPASWLVERLLTDGGVSGIIGEPKTTKSWLAIEVALSVASGTPVLGWDRFRVPRARPAAYFFAEDHHESVVSRIRAFAAGRGVNPEDLARNLHVQPRGKYLDLSKDDDVARVIASARMIGQLGLLVLDPLRDVHSGKENESDDMAAVFKRLRLIAVLLDCAVLVVHHAKKPGKEGATNGNEIRGSSVINGALDARILLKGLSGDGECVFTNTVEALVKRGRSAGTFQVTLTIEDGADGTAKSARWMHATKAEAAAAGEAEKSALAVEDHAIALVEFLHLTEARKEPAPNQQKIRKALGGAMTRTYAALECASGKLWIQRTTGGRYQLTDAGRQFAREAADKPPEDPPAATLADLVE